MSRRWGIGCCALGLLTLGATPVAGQWLKVDRPRASIGTSFNGAWYTLPAANDLARIREHVRVDLGGEVGPYPILRIRMMAQPFFGQGWASSLPEDANMDEDGITGRASVAILPRMQINGRVDGAIGEAFSPDAFGGFTRDGEESWSATVQDENPLLPVSVSVTGTTRDLFRYSGLSGSSLQIDQRIRELRYTAHNWKTRLLYFQRELDTEVTGRLPVEQFERQATAENRIRWGKGSRLLSRGRYFERTRGTTSRSLLFGSAATLQHWATLGSEYEWSRNRQWGDEFDLKTDDFRARLRYAPTGGPRAVVEISRREMRTGVLYDRAVRLSPQVGFDHAFSRRVRLLGDLMAGYTWQERGADAVSYIFVLEERLIFGAARQVELENAFVDPASVVLLSPADGTRFEEGFDYRLQEDGPFLRIVALPGGRIAEGTEAVAEYRYEAAPAVSSRSINARGSLTLAVGSFSLIYRQRLTSDLDDLPAQVFPLLEDQDQKEVGLQYQGTMSFVSVSAYTGVSRWRASQARGDRFIATLSLRSQTSSGLAVAVRSGVTSARASVGGFVTADSEARLIWLGTPWLRPEVFVSHFYWDEENRRDRFLGAGSAVSVTLGATEFQLRLDTVRRDRLLQTGTEYRISARLSRRF